jgi:TatD DNase family protein
MPLPAIIDTHCHLDLEAFDADREQVLQRARANGVGQIIVPGVTADRWQTLADFCGTDPGLHAALGLHPVFLDSHSPGDLQALPGALEKNSVVAVGEIGLDFALKELDRSRQIALLEQQLAIAESACLPVILHVRKAHDEMLRLLGQYSLPGGTAHAFNGSIQQGMQYAGMGFKLGFGGMLTFTRSSRLRRLARELPIDAIVLETDAPDLTVASHQGERNSPEYLPEVLAALAEVRGESPDEIAARTTHNARSVFNLG